MDDGEFDIFIEKITIVFRQLHPWSIMNIDDTIWRTIQNYAQTAQIRGKEGIVCLFAANPAA
jgi:hypothetical protein